MRYHPLFPISALALAVAAAAPAQTSLADQRSRLLAAKRDSAAAAARAETLSRAAASERNAAEKARAEEAALAERVAAAAAELKAAGARMRIVRQLLDEQRARLAAAQRPVARLLAALTSLARRPTIVAVAQPGSVDDLVHVRAVLGSALPVVRERTTGVREEMERTRRLVAAAGLAETALRDGRLRLDRERIALARLEADHRARATALGRNAISESDRALALGERARDLVDRMAEDGLATATEADLAALPGPEPRPLAAGAMLPVPPAGVYRVPVRGRLVTGLDEISGAGVRSRGLTFAVPAAAPVVAPAAGIVRFARPFRGYGRVVIIDHGDGWNSLVTGLGTLDVAAGRRVRAGSPIGTAATGDDPRITVELRRRGRPIDIAALVG